MHGETMKFDGLLNALISYVLLIPMLSYWFREYPDGCYLKTRLTNIQAQ
jgi:hypothetical protein